MSSPLFSNVSSQIKLCIFDFGRVLIELDRDLFTKRLREVFTLPDEDVFTTLHEELLALGVGEYEFPEFVTRVSEKHGVVKNLPEEKQYENALFAFNSMLGPPIEGTVSLLKSLPCKSVVLSNTNRVHWEEIEKYCEFLPLFKNIYLSHELHLHKPDAEIYQIVLEQEGVAAEEAIFIDDTAINVRASEELGINGVVFENSSELQRELQDLLTR